MAVPTCLNGAAMLISLPAKAPRSGSIGRIACWTSSNDHLRTIWIQDHEANNHRLGDHGGLFRFVLGIGFALKRYMKTSKDFFLSGRSLPAWITGLAFISANLGAQEVIGMGASGAKYGIATSHFYWIGAIPAMVFVGVFMMPFYYGSRARSVPEYLKLRFDEKTRGFNAITFAAMTVFSSGISLYAMGLLLGVLLGWDFTFSVMISGVIVLIYIFLGGLTSAIYNEVLQFFLIVFGFAPLVFLGLKDIGGWSGLVARLNGVATSQGYRREHGPTRGSTVQSSSNPMVLSGLACEGIGFVLSFGYWCTDFLLYRRHGRGFNVAARRTPLIAAVQKMFSHLVILGNDATPNPPPAHRVRLTAELDGTYNYDLAIPMMLGTTFPRAFWGGSDSLMASFMSGMRAMYRFQYGVDLRHLPVLLNVAPATHTIFGWAGWLRSSNCDLGCGCVLATRFNNSWTCFSWCSRLLTHAVRDISAGMFWKRATGHGAFIGLLSGTWQPLFTTE